jgi:superfamily II DNA/RNA helicase
MTISQRRKSLPIALVTTRELEARRKRGALLESGARATPKELQRELRRFGRRLGKPHDDFLSAEQEIVIHRALEGEDVLAVMPTGSGKSLTYQFTAFLKPNELTLVISPLKRTRIGVLRVRPPGS